MSEALPSFEVVEPERAAGAPLLVGLHEGGQSAELFRALAMSLGLGYRHLLPRASDLVPGASSWSTTGEELAARGHTLLAAVESWGRRLSCPPGRTCLWGFGGGGVLALHAALLAQVPFAGAICVGGGLSASAAGDGLALARAKGRSFLVVHGVEDAVVPLAEAQRSHRLLTGAGADADLAELPMGHEVGPLALAAMRGYLARILG